MVNFLERINKAKQDTINEIIAKVEGLRKEKYPIDTEISDNKEIVKLGRRLDDCTKAYNKALIDLIALIKEK